MKICILTSTYSPQVIGANVYIKKISHKLAENKHQVVVIAANHNNEKKVEKNGEINIRRFRPFNLSTFNHIGKRTMIEQGIWTILDIYNHYSYFRIKKFLKYEKPDVVHIHTPLDISLSAFSAVKDVGIPLVLTLHDYLLLCRRIVLRHDNGKLCCDGSINLLCRAYKAFARNLVNRTVDAVIAPSKFIIEQHRRAGFFKKTSDFLLPHGIDLKGSGESLTVKDENKRGIDILYAGSLTRHKGVDVLIRAVRGIENEDIKLHIVGGGIFEDHLKKMAAGDKRIIFYGEVEHKNIHKFYSMSDVMVVPSVWYEVFGMVIQEAFRAGVPVIGSRIGGIPEIIKNGRNGYLFAAGDIAGLKNILEDVIKDPKKLTILGRNAFESMRKYEMSEHIEKLITIYRKTGRLSNV